MNPLPRILLAEDSSEDAELVLEALAEYRIANTVLHVKDGEEALDYLYRRGAFANYPPIQPAVVLLDLKMPKVDGISLISFMRESNPALPIVVFTGVGYDEEQMHAALRAGANGYVSKNLPIEQLYCVLARVLATCQQRRPSVAFNGQQPALAGAA